MEGYNACTEILSDGSRRTVLQHREIMEKHLGRRLRKNEIVHHKDKKKKNNRLRNLKVMLRRHHSAHHNPERKQTLTCLLCQKVFERNACLERNNRAKGKKGPFCGRSCAAKWARATYQWITRGSVKAHGTDNCYAYHGCRCQACREAHRIKIAEWRKGAGTQTGKAARLRSV